MNITIELLRVVGSPFKPTTFSKGQDQLVELSHVAARNRMLFFYLHSIGTSNSRKLVTLYKNGQISFVRTNDAIARVSQILTNANIEYAFFKSIRPYTSTTVDLDILIFGENEDYVQSVETMRNAGCELIVCGPRSTTLRDKEANIGIDLYSEIAVSFIIYMDKRTLHSHATTTKLPNNEYAMTLKPEADLSCIIAHSIIKEQMYTLSEYYTFIHYLKQMDINNFIKITKENNILSATRTHTAITALLHKTAHGTIPERLQQITRRLGEDEIETTRLVRSNFETPHKYHSFTVARSLLEITKGKESRNSMAIQLYQMLHPNFTRKFLKTLMKHVTRETY